MGSQQELREIDELVCERYRVGEYLEAYRLSFDVRQCVDLFRDAVYSPELDNIMKICLISAVRLGEKEIKDVFETCLRISRIGPAMSDSVAKAIVLLLDKNRHEDNQYAIELILDMLIVHDWIHDILNKLVYLRELDILFGAIKDERLISNIVSAMNDLGILEEHTDL